MDVALSPPPSIVIQILPAYLDVVRCAASECEATSGPTISERINGAWSPITSRYDVAKPKVARPTQHSTNTGGKPAATDRL